MIDNPLQSCRLIVCLIDTNTSILSGRKYSDSRPVAKFGVEVRLNTESDAEQTIGIFFEKFYRAIAIFIKTDGAVDWILAEEYLTIFLLMSFGSVFYIHWIELYRSWDSAGGVQPCLVRPWDLFWWVLVILVIIMIIRVMIMVMVKEMLVINGDDVGFGWW